jgi:hypothetical protein
MREMGLQKAIDFALMIGKTGRAPPQEGSDIGNDVARLIEIPGKESVLHLATE